MFPSGNIKNFCMIDNMSLPRPLGELCVGSARRSFSVEIFLNIFETRSYSPCFRICWCIIMYVHTAPVRVSYQSRDYTKSVNLESTRTYTHRSTSIQRALKLQKYQKSESLEAHRVTTHIESLWHLTSTDCVVVTPASLRHCNNCFLQRSGRSQTLRAAPARGGDGKRSCKHQ